jgi:hypothetical protein
MTVIVLALLLGLIPAFIARNKGRSFVAWYVYGALLFVVALVHVLCLKDRVAVYGGPWGKAGAWAPNFRPCFDCGSPVWDHAHRCHSCGSTKP